MPIKGATDKASQVARFPQLGMLRKGGPRPKDGKRPGKELNHFRFTSDDLELVELFTEQYGKEPKRLTVYLPFRAVDECFRTQGELWVGGGLMHRCDTETCSLWWDEENKVYSREPKPCPGGCNWVGRLTVLLPRFWQKGHVGYVTLGTTSKHDILHIHGVLLGVAEGRGEENMSGIAFDLTRPQRSSSYLDTDGNRKRSTHWFVGIAPNADWMRSVQMERVLAVSGQIPANVPMLGDGTVIDQETGEVVETPQPEPEQEEKKPPKQRQSRKRKPAEKPAEKAKAARPMEPETLYDAIDSKRKYLLKKGDESKEVAPTKRQDLVAARLNALFDGNLATKTALRKQLMVYLFKFDTVRELTDAQCGAVEAWAGDLGEPDAFSVTEAQAVIDELETEPEEEPEEEVNELEDTEEIPF